MSETETVKPTWSQKLTELKKLREQQQQVKRQIETVEKWILEHKDTQGLEKGTNNFTIGEHFFKIVRKFTFKVIDPEEFPEKFMPYVTMKIEHSVTKAKSVPIEQQDEFSKLFEIKDAKPTIELK